MNGGREGTYSTERGSQTKALKAPLPHLPGSKIEADRPIFTALVTKKTRTRVIGNELQDEEGKKSPASLGLFFS